MSHETSELYSEEFTTSTAQYLTWLQSYLKKKLHVLHNISQDFRANKISDHQVLVTKISELLWGSHYNASTCHHWMSHRTSELLTHTHTHTHNRSCLWPHSPRCKLLLSSMGLIRMMSLPSLKGTPIIMVLIEIEWLKGPSEWFNANKYGNIVTLLIGSYANYANNVFQQANHTVPPYMEICH